MGDLLGIIAFATEIIVLTMKKHVVGKSRKKITQKPKFSCVFL